LADKEITITKDKIEIRNRIYLWKSSSYMSTVFSTNLAYMMTDPNGVFKAGGYEKCPTFYGRSSDPNSGITEKDNGWYPTDLIRGNFNYSAGSDIYLDIPAFDQYKTVLQVSSGFARQYLSTYQYIYLGSTIVGTFRWSAAWIPVGTDGDGNPYYNMAIWIQDISLWYSNKSGTYRFPYTSINDWTTSIYDYDAGTYYTATFASQERWYDPESNTYYWRYPSPIMNNMCLMFLKNPSSLSISVTP
jgi:hypothetical protein